MTFTWIRVRMIFSKRLYLSGGKRALMYREKSLKNIIFLFGGFGWFTCRQKLLQKLIASGSCMPTEINAKLNSLLRRLIDLVRLN